MRILIVEDEEKLAEVLAEGLSKKGYAVDTVSDGTKAFARISIHRNDYDLVILDPKHLRNRNSGKLTH